MKKAAGPNGPTAKKDPPAQNRRVDKIYLRLQKNAPFSTRLGLGFGVIVSWISPWFVT